jgi:hypothetical protein
LSDSRDAAWETSGTHRIKIQSREDLVSVLSEASALEHMIMCEYLFAAFSLKRDESEGVDRELLEKLRGWEEVIDTVAVQEMTHLALVNNMLVSVGSGPYFQHPNFPQPSRYFPPNIRLALMPFGEQALRHFLYLERPEGMSIEGVPGFEVLGDLNPPELKGGIVPQQEYFSTVGNLYRGIEKGFADLVDKYGEDGVFIGAEHAQATEEIFGLPSLFQVKDLASAQKAVEGIVEMGEGARGDWTNAHFGMFLRIFKEFMDTKKMHDDFRPTRPVTPAFVRPPLGQENVTLITDPFTSKVADLFNASYGLAIHALSRFYAHQKQYPDELQALADTAVGMMEGVLEPLGIVLTSLPVGSRFPGVNAGPSFELQHREYLLPHRKEAFMVIQERLLELSKYVTDLSGEAPSRKVGTPLKSVAASFSKLAEGLAVDSLDS